MRSFRPLKPSLSFIAPLAALAAGQCAFAQSAPSFNPVTLRLWQQSMPDFYQHQLWGKSGAGGQNNSGWEKAVVIKNGNVAFQANAPGGWCRIAAFVDALAYWRANGYADLLPGGILIDATWLGFANGAIFDTAKFMFHPTNADKDRTVQALLKSKGHGEEKGAGPGKGLRYTQFIWPPDFGMAPATVSRLEADQSLTPIRAFGLDVPFSVVASAHFARGSSVTLFVTKNGGATSPLLWWTNYHNVTLAGIDLDDHMAFFADPDSNKGNADGNAGWNSAKQSDPAINGRKHKPWDGADDKLPVPAPGGGFPPADPVNFSDFYFAATFTVDGRAIDGAVAANARYKNVTTSMVEVIAPVWAAPKAAPVKGGGRPGGEEFSDGFAHKFEITPGAVGAIDELWLIPNAMLDYECLPTFELPEAPELAANWIVEALPPGTVDPHGRVRDFGAVRVALADSRNPRRPFAPLGAGMIGEVSFCTSDHFEPFVDGYDVLLHDPMFETLLEPEYAQLFLPQSFGPAIVGQTPGPQGAPILCPADFNGDGTVDGGDLGLFLAQWATDELLPFDLDGDDEIGASDLGAFLSMWGPCP